VAEAIYLTCALASIACALLLRRGYRGSRTPLLFWSSLCFAGLAVNNVILFVDKILVPSVDLGLWRSGSALVAMMLLLFGQIWESK
jgi:hypothetical protein